MPQPSTTKSNDKGQDESKDLTFYPAYCYPISPTWYVWVKLTCYDIHHHLKPRPASQLPPHHLNTSNAYSNHGGSGSTYKDAPLDLFYLNHPIQFIQICGVIVAYEEYHPTFYLFTVDDSSGATVDVVCRKPRPEPELTSTSTLQPEPHPKPLKKPTHSSQEEEDETHPSPALLTLLSTLTIGTVIIAKGTLSTFRSNYQLTLLRLSVVPTTTQELAHISSRTTFLNTVLSRPWTVPEETREKLLMKAKGEVEEDGSRARRARERQRHREKRERRHAEEITRVYEEVEEVLRRDGAERARRDGLSVAGKRREGEEIVRRKAL